MSSRLPTRAALLAGALLALAPSAASQDVAAFGVLRDASGFVPPCTLFETDDGVRVALAGNGGLSVGQRAWVEGSVTGVKVCGGLLLAQLDVAAEPAFAGTGVLAAGPDGAPRLVTDGGDVYALTDAAGFTHGTRLFVEGRVHGAGTVPRVEPAVIGPAYAAFGLLAPAESPSGWGVRVNGALVGLARLGLAAPQADQPVFVEGRLPAGLPQTRGGATGGSAAGGLAGAAAPPGAPSGPGGPALTEPADAVALPAPPLLLDPVISRAAFFAGSVIRSDGVVTVKAEVDLFDDVFELPADVKLAPGTSLEVGSRVYVRGRALTDFDPLEDPASRAIRGARVGPAFSACGVLLDAAGGPPLLLTTEGLQVQLEDAGTLPPADLRYVAGRLESLPGGGLRLADNRILPCVSITGTLELGFECSPLLVVSDSDQVFTLEDPPGVPVGTTLSVLGGVGSCDELCPFPCLVAEELTVE